MYSTNGPFGQVRLARLLKPIQNAALFTLSSIGWHSCNDQYRIFRPNGADEPLLLFTLRGEGFLQLQKTKYTLKPGSIALVPRNEPNSYGTPPNGMWEFYWIHPCGAAVFFLDQVTALSGRVITFADDYAYRQKLESLLELCTERPPHFDWLLSQQLSELLHRIAFCLCDKLPQTSLSKRTVSYLEHHFSEKITLDQIAQELYVSTAHLIRMFRQEIGCTPHQYLTQYRLKTAEHLLESGSNSVEQIAALTGFSSASHFISQFKRLHHCTPFQYRHQFSSGAMIENAKERI